MRTFKAIIAPTVNGGNIEVKITANSAMQAQELIKTLPYFKSFVRMPFVVNETGCSSKKLERLISQANNKAK
jgi:hypothetical protein